MAGTVIDSLIVILGLDGSNYKKGAEDVLVTNKKVQDNSTTMASSLESSGKQLADFWRGFKGEALAVLAILGGGTGLVALLNSAANAASATARSAANVGTSVSKFSAWQAVAPQVGASDADVTSAFGTVSGAAQAQLHGQQNAAAAFIQNYLKVPLLNANGTERDTDDIMKEVAAVYQKNNAVTDNWFNSQIGFSQGFGNELQMPDLTAQLASLVTETEAQAKAAAAVTKQEGIVDAEMTALKNTLMGIAAPALTTGLHDFAEDIADLGRTLNKPDLATALNDFAESLPPMTKALDSVDWQAIGNVLKYLLGPATALNTAQGDINSGAAWVHKHIIMPFLDFPSSPSNPLPNLSEPLGIRNNNPLNLKYAGQDGAFRGSDGFAVFSSQDAGIAADYKQLLLDQNRGASTLAQLITKWAPPGDNNTAAYIAAVSKATGIGPNQAVNMRDPVTAVTVISAMSQQEGSGSLSQFATLGPIRSVLGLPNGPEAQPGPPGLSANVTALLSSLRDSQKAALTKRITAGPSNGLPPNVTALLNGYRAQQHAAQIRVAQNSASKQRPVSVTTGDIHVHTPAKDADGISKSIKKSLNNHLVMLTNSGVN